MFLRRIDTRVTLPWINRLFSNDKFAKNKSFNRYIGSVEILQKWKNKFEEEKVPEVQSSLKIILAHVLNVKKLRELPQSSEELSMTKSEQEQFEKLCECRMARMPVQYIIGEWDFRELTLKMKPPVFIPRPETEELVELILQQYDVKEPLNFLEIGCGTGCISLSLLYSLPKAKSVAIDQSQMACDLTSENAKRLQLENRIQVIRHKLTEESQLSELENSLDLIVSNPPYVPNRDLLNLEPEIKLYEDLRALDGGADGLVVIKNLLRLATKTLKRNGHLWLEVDPTHPELIRKYLQENISELQLKFVASYKDVFQKDRFVEITKL